MSTSLEIACGVLEAAKVHEESWDMIREQYAVSIEDAAKSQIHTDEVELVTMLLVSNWNEALDWANSKVK